MSFEIPITVTSNEPKTGPWPIAAAGDEPAVTPAVDPILDREVDIVRALGATFVLAAALVGVLSGLGSLLGG